MAETKTVTPTEELATKDGALADAIERELKRLPSDDAELEQRCITALNRWLKRSRSGTFTQYLYKARNIIRRTVHPERKVLRLDALVIDANVMPNKQVRDQVVKTLIDSDATAEDLKSIHEGLAQLRKMPDAKEPWKTVLHPFMSVNPMRPEESGFTPDAFMEAARTVVWTVLGTYD